MSNKYRNNLKYKRLGLFVCGISAFLMISAMVIAFVAVLPYWIGMQ